VTKGLGDSPHRADTEPDELLRLEFVTLSQ
jgi:hypothetical protein